MAIKLAFTLLLMFALVSTESETDEETDEDTLSQPFYTETETDQQALSQALKELEQQVANLLKREQIVKVAEKRLHAREKKFHEFQKEKLKQLEMIDDFAQELQQLEKSLQKREQRIASREETLAKREKQLNEREHKVQENTERCNIRKEHVKIQKREYSIYGNELRETNTLNHGSPDESKILVQTNLFPNPTSVAVFCNEETNEITWKDPQNLIQNELKESLERSFMQRDRKEMSNYLFDCLSNSFLSRESKPFIEELILAMSQSVDVKKRNKYNQTPLMFSVDFGAEKAVLKLIERHANLEAVDEYGMTALHLAAQKGNVSCCKILLEKGATLQKDNYGWTPLKQAQVCESNEVVQLLLQKFGDPKMEEADMLKLSPKRCVRTPLKSRSSNEKEN